MLRTAFYFTRSATTGFTVSAFLYPSRVSLKEAFAVLELCARKLACTVLRGPDPSNGVWLLGANPDNRLRPEMLASAEIPVGERKRILLVPSEAIQQIDGQDIVFVRTAADRFNRSSGANR